MFNEDDYIKGIYSIYTDPREFDGNKVRCILCDNEAEDWDEVCEDHQICDDCSEYNLDCRCDFFIEQYNRNRQPKDWIKNISEIDY